MPTAAEVLRVSDQEDEPALVARAGQTLREGGLVVLPTETVYGAAAVLNQPQARRRLRNLPPQMADRPLVVHLADRAGAQAFLGQVGPLGQRMMRKLWPGPVALVFEVPQERQRQVAAALDVPADELYESGRITLRCPDHPVAREVLSHVGLPVVMRRAGTDRADSAPRVEDAVQQWGSAVDLIVDAGPTRFAKPSTVLRVGESSYELARIGVYDRRIIERMLRTTILFVCSGNTCRSPLAAALARRIVARRVGVEEAKLEERGISVVSAGTYAISGVPATPQAVEAAAQMGLDLARHRSRPISVELIHEADAVFTMGRSHMSAVIGLVPAAAGKVRPLDPEGDIEDPIGGDVALYRRLAERLQGLIENRLAEIAVL